MYKRQGQDKGGRKADEGSAKAQMDAAGGRDLAIGYDIRLWVDDFAPGRHSLNREKSAWYALFLLVFCFIVFDDTKIFLIHLIHDHGPGFGQRFLGLFSDFLRLLRMLKTIEHGISQAFYTVLT